MDRTTTERRCHGQRTIASRERTREARANHAGAEDFSGVSMRVANVKEAFVEEEHDLVVARDPLSQLIGPHLVLERVRRIHDASATKHDVRIAPVFVPRRQELASFRVAQSLPPGFDEVVEILRRAEKMGGAGQTK